MISERDREALDRALQMSIDGEDRERARRAREQLEEVGWWEAATNAAHDQQYKALGLSPWLRPPCEFDESGDPYHQNRGGVDDAPIKLLRRMLSHGLSRWEPDPITTIATAKRK